MPDLPIGAALRRLAEAAPQRAAVVQGDVTLTRADLVDRAEAVARWWVRDGLRVDDVVAVALPTGPDLLVACAAAWTAGATPLVLSPDLPVAERRSLLAAVDVARLVDRPLPTRVGDVPPGPPLGDPERRVAAGWKISPSSGSTGLPKLVRATAPARVDPSRGVTSFLPAEQVQLVSAPLSHSAPLTYAARGLMTGHTLVLAGGGFDPGEWLRLVARHRVTWALLVPTTMLRVWRHPDRASADVSSLRTLLHLGAPCPPWLKRAWLGWLGPDRVTEVYAGTESAGVVVCGGHDWLARPGTVGRPVGGTELRVVDPDGVPVPAGAEGLVEMRRPRATYAYVGRPTPGDGDPAAWHTLGDLGHLDADGWLHLAGRADDVVTTGGVSVHPAPVEAAIEAHPAVRSALVVGRPDDDLGERLHAVVDDAGAGLGAAELTAWLGERVDRDARPRSWEVVDRPLRDAAGKARRRDWR